MRGARLKNDEQVAGRESHQRSAGQEGDRSLSAFDARRGYQQESSQERRGDDSFSGASLVPTAMYEGVGNPATQRLAGAKDEEGKRRHQPGLDEVKMADGEKIVRQPRHHQVPIVVEAKKADADAEEVPIEGYDSRPSRSSRSRLVAPSDLSGCGRKSRREDRQPRNQPEQSRETDNHKYRAPAKARNHTGYHQAPEGQPGARSEVKQAGRQTALLLGEEQADDFGAAREINGFSDAEQNAEQNQNAQAACQAGETLGQRPDRERSHVKPAEIESIRKQSRRNLHEAVRPEKGREKHSLECGAKAEVNGDDR